MKSQFHLFYSVLVSLILFVLNFSLLDIFIFLISSIVLIDLDHVPSFILREKSINPFKFFRWSYEKKEKWDKLSLKEKMLYKKPIYLFHNIEFLLILFLVSKFFNIFIFVFWGFLFHLLLDLCYNIYSKEEKYFKLSLVYTLVKNKKRRTLQ